ncbi:MULTISPECIES: hypothetical protein [unclassified Lentimonas]|uniref:hypothetical protein n=1 Tax=unclassified Lentimonas TaxID=2630993 RepID=UPI001322B08B|nr:MULTISPECIES: hypothetical protein [unclassified Lentimonas]CAA6697631.1 Unannotated [Lentimonas sp. CC10]CAA6697771.1 Unannotated [Lentimonas sp. CC19]CAA7072499.1 Unannotated [Lentimonas sp. CC11]
MKRIAIILLMLLGCHLFADDKIVGTWDNTHNSSQTKKGRTQIWHFTERGNILREYQCDDGTGTGTRVWTSISGTWKIKNEDDRTYYQLTWFNKYESASEFVIENGIEYLVIAHGCNQYYLLPRLEPVE